MYAAVYAGAVYATGALYAKGAVYADATGAVYATATPGFAAANATKQAKTN